MGNLIPAQDNDGWGHGRMRCAPGRECLTGYSSSSHPPGRPRHPGDDSRPDQPHPPPWTGGAKTCARPPTDAERAAKRPRRAKPDHERGQRRDFTHDEEDPDPVALEIPTLANTLVEVECGATARLADDEYRGLWKGAGMKYEDESNEVFWLPTPYADDEPAMPTQAREAWRQWNDFATEDGSTWVLPVGGPRDFEDPLSVAAERKEVPRIIRVEHYDETPAPHQGAVTSMADWWKTAFHFAKELYPTAPICRIGIVGLALASLAPGQQLILGLARDGTAASGPRPGYDRKRKLRTPRGATLHTFDGKPIYKSSQLMTVYVAVPMSSLSVVLKNGFRGRCQPSDVARQTSYRKGLARKLGRKGDGKGRTGRNLKQPLSVCIYGSRSKKCAAGYPYQQWPGRNDLGGGSPGQFKRGELYSADGTCPQYAVIQGSLIRRTATGESTVLWERRHEGNNQVAFHPKYFCPEVVHVYGAEKAYRPFRATGFSEETQLQVRTDCKHWRKPWLHAGLPINGKWLPRELYGRENNVKKCGLRSRAGHIDAPETSADYHLPGAPHETPRPQRYAFGPSLTNDDADTGGQPTDIRAELGGRSSEFIRKLRIVERITHSSDLGHAAGHLTTPCTRRVSRKTEPLKRGQTRADANTQQRSLLGLGVAAQIDLGAIPDHLFPDDGVRLIPAPRENETSEEKAARLERQGDWRRFPPYLNLRRQLRSTSLFTATADDDPVSRTRALMTEEDWENDSQDAGPYTIAQTPLELAEQIDRSERADEKAGDGNGGKASPSGLTPTGRRTTILTPRAPPLPNNAGLERMKNPAAGTFSPIALPPVRFLEIDINDREQWKACEGCCGRFNVGTVGTNYCCEACGQHNAGRSLPHGMHGKRCRNLQVTRGNQQSLNRPRTDDQ